MASEIEQLGSNPMPPPPPTQPPAPGPARPQRDFWQIMRLIGSIGGLTIGIMILLTSPLAYVEWGECAGDFVSDQCKSDQNRRFLGIVGIAAIPLVPALLSFVKDPKIRKYSTPLYVLGGLALMIPLPGLPSLTFFFFGPTFLTFPPGLGLIAHAFSTDETAAPQADGMSSTARVRSSSLDTPSVLYRASAASFFVLLFVIGAQMFGVRGAFLPSTPLLFLLWIALAIAGFVMRLVENAQA